MYAVVAAVELAKYPNFATTVVSVDENATPAAFLNTVSVPIWNPTEAAFDIEVKARRTHPNVPTILLILFIGLFLGWLKYSGLLNSRCAVVSDRI